MNSSDCPSRQGLRAYNIGRLPEDAAAKLIEHLETCPVCEETIADLGGSSDTLIAALGRPLAADPVFEEAELAPMLSLIQSIGLDPSFGGDRGEPAGGEESAELGRIGVYQLLEKLGQGGMGAVYKALHTKLDKIVALKVLPTDRMQDQRAVARFEREMKAVGRLEHPNIVRASDAGEHNGVHFLVMEYVSGCDLSALVRQRGPLPVADACELIRQAATGLQYAHDLGLVHRDIKPSNLMLSSGIRCQVSGVRCQVSARRPPGLRHLPHPLEGRVGVWGKTPRGR